MNRDATVTVMNLHDAAMEACDEAATCCDPTEALALWRKAFELEMQAIGLFLRSGKPDSEPTRSVLMRSAASIAIDAGLLREAEQLVCRALAGNPPHPIDDQLRELNDTLRLVARCTP